MPLTADELFVIREWVGSTPDDTELNTIYDTLAAGYDATVMYVLNQRLVKLSLAPSSITVPGLSVSHGSDLQALNELIAKFQNGGGTGLDEESSYGMQITTIRRDFVR